MTSIAWALARGQPVSPLLPRVGLSDGVLGGVS